MPQAHSFNGAPLPPFVYLGRYRRHSRDKLDQAFLLCFCLLQAIKNRMVGSPGNKATAKLLVVIPSEFPCVSYSPHTLAYKVAVQGFHPFYGLFVSLSYQVLAYFWLACCVDR